MKQERINKILVKMGDQKIPQMIITDPSSIFYLTGKWFEPGERILALYLNINGKHKMFINELFPCEEDLGVDIVWLKDTDDGIAIISEYTEKDKVLGIDKNWPAGFLLRLMELKGAKEYVNSSPIIDRARMIKDDEEKELMRISSRINDMAIEKLISYAKEGITELEMCEKLSEIYKELGADGYSFEPIVAFSANASDPHHDCDNTPLKVGDSIVIDIGCKKDSYCSDMTRTVFFKKASPKGREVFEIVLGANKAGIAAVKPGARFCDIDKAARDYIEQAGYGKYFTHRTGHSIGIEDHDFGDVSSVNTDLLEPGMIFSVEPGIYLPGDVGVRIEDLVLVTEDGCEVLNSVNKEFTII